MRYIFTIIGSVVIAVSLVALGFNIRQVNQERATLTTNLEQRASLLSDSLKESVEPYYANSSQPSFQNSLQKVVNKFANRERLAGIALYDNKGVLIATSSGLPKNIIENTKIVSDTMDSNTSNNAFFDADGESRYVHVDPLHNDESIVGALMIVQNAGYISTNINQIWKGNLLRLLIQVIIFSITLFVILRFFVFRQVIRLVESIKKIRTGENKEIFKEEGKYSFFTPLAKEITYITKSLSEARLSAKEEARMRLEKLDTPWTAERLSEFTTAHLKGRSVFVVSNREPYIHQKIKNKINCIIVPSGMNTAIGAMMEACGGTWIASGSGNADKETSNENGKISVPIENPKYTLKRIWLTDQEMEGYYSFSVEAMYSLCLMVHIRPIFRKEDWHEYKKVNGIFAKNVLEEIKNIPNPIIIIQDYHLSLLPQIIKESRPDAQIGIFWHVPWPSPEAFSVCPWRKEILQGMLGADLVGFNTQQFCNNFIDTVGKEVESLIDWERFSITHKTHITHIKTFPVSIAFTNDKETDDNLEKNQEINNILKKLNIKTQYLGLGVDRMDYAKGIPEKFKGIELFFENHPEYIEKLTFLQIAPLHREHIEKYKEYRRIVKEETNRINEKLGTSDWHPIILEEIQYPHTKLNELFKRADFCLITSIHDSMNLVAKEYIATRRNEDGVLILSQFAGASKDLKNALIINPYNAEETAESIFKAINMPIGEQHQRMKIMRNSVKNYNVYRWSAELVKAITDLN